MAENDKAGDNKQQDITKFLIMTIASIVIMFVVWWLAFRPKLED